ncbi:MAG: FAD-dependent oxidoreductase [Methylotenera sp.]|uniref:FAD-dependent 5-carboxymethylaminomethyl-2-thiouridine(34) oxidoreductase MnmC n=1 Tax=Methylotenera sp. TaxID=2051956 RepID=UPI000D468500|nr:FAD-dependent 5-carboxymethylaminomethyl-2-thiouridine(34) oxidoreductase MnmC [Methylotenera sp.]PPC82039.1 MAG: FAD-dependent oxidoreductase [Methylotenera sp.]
MTKSAIVIGGGISGCSSAYALAKRGMQVTLIERNAEIANSASGNPLAMLYPRLSGDDLSSQFALESYLYSLSFYQSLALPASDFSACGMLQLGFNSRELSRIKKVAMRHESAEFLQYVSHETASQIAGISVAHDALYFHLAAWVHPKHLCLHLTDHQHIQVIHSQNISHFLKHGDKFEVYSQQQHIATADVIVIANANDAQQLLPDLPLNTRAVRGQVSLLNSTPDSQKINTIICSDGYLSPAAYSAQSHCLGASFADTDLDATKPLDVTPSLADHATNLDKLSNISPTLYQQLKEKIVGGRVSYRCTTTDYWPLVGELINANALKIKPVRPSASTDSLPWLSGLYINAAHGSKGFTSAPMCAELIANMICGEPFRLQPELACQLNPNRFLLKALGLKKLANSIATQHKISG